MIVKSSHAAFLRSARVTPAQIQEGRTSAKAAPGAPYVVGYTPGGARMEITARYAYHACAPSGGAVYSWRYTYQISGYSTIGSDLSLTPRNECGSENGAHSVD